MKMKLKQSQNTKQQKNKSCKTIKLVDCKIHLLLGSKTQTLLLN
jgi:hypothetical protein